MIVIDTVYMIVNENKSNIVYAAPASNAKQAWQNVIDRFDYAMYEFLKAKGYTAKK